MLGLLSGCGSKPNPELEEAYQQAAAAFVADESFDPILDEELFYFNSHRLDTIGVEYINEQDAVKRLMKLDTWLAFTTRQFTDNELKSLQAQKYLPRAIPIAYDGLAIIVNNQNPDTCITVKDFARILRGEATQWSDIYPKSKLGTIDVVFDNPLSSTVRWCVDSILDGKEFTNPNIGAVKTSAAVIDYVERHQNSLGIIGCNWLNDKRDTTNVTFKKNIPVMGGHFPQFNNVSVLQHAAYDRNGRRIVGVLNFWDFGEAFFRLQAKGLAAGDNRIVDELGVLWAPSRKKSTWTDEELAAGVVLVVPSLRTRVFEIVPAAEAVSPTSVFTASDVAALSARRKPELAKAAAWDADYEANNKVEKSTEPLGVYK